MPDRAIAFLEPKAFVGQTSWSAADVHVGLPKVSTGPQSGSGRTRADREVCPTRKISNSPEEPVRIPVTDVFDLHTVPPRDVKVVVEAYLEEAHSLGLKALRIIHGRGIGVQREIVRAVLARTDFVVDFRDAPAEAGGWGATVVTLR
jgi:Smr domain